MVKEIIVGEQNLKLLSNGATPIRYRMIFHNDLMVEINQVNKGQKDEGELLELVSRLAYVMNGQAEGKIALCNSEDYLTWLEGYEAMDFANVAKEVLGVYLGQTIGESKPKKRVGQSTGK